MCRGDHPAFDPVDMLQNGDSQRRAFGRVSSCTYLIQQDKTFRGHPLQYGDNIGHMAGECTKALLNTLLIPNIGINGIKYTHLAAFLCRDE
ncbi:hypothetical protein D3C81_1421470 [compost metagenome]